MSPGVVYLSQSSEEQLCRGSGPVQEDLRDQSDGHLQDTQQTDGQVEAGRTHLQHRQVSQSPNTHLNTQLNTHLAGSLN